MENTIVRAYDYLRFGVAGDYVEGNGIRVTRASGGVNTMPTCILRTESGHQEIWEPDTVKGWLAKMVE